MTRRPRFDQFVSSQTGVLSAPEICNKVLKPLKWIIEGVMPLDGITMLMAPPKAGKSILAMNIAVENALGARALNFFRPQEPQHILYIDLEGTERRTQDRMMRALGNSPIPPTLHFAYTWERIQDGGLSRLYDYAEHHPEVKLFIIDTLGKIQRASKGNNVGYSYKADVDEIGILHKFCMDSDVSILLIHHTRKTDSHDWVDMASGTHGITGSVDTLMYLQRARGEFQGLLNVTGRDVEDQSFRLNIDMPRQLINVIGEDTEEETELTDAQRDIYVCLQTVGEPMSPLEISQTIGKTPGSVKRLLANMVEDGKVIRIGYGKYVDRLR
jgi:hypothetical protein